MSSRPGSQIAREFTNGGGGPSYTTCLIVFDQGMVTYHVSQITGIAGARSN